MHTFTHFFAIKDDDEQIEWAQIIESPRSTRRHFSKSKLSKKQNFAEKKTNVEENNSRCDVVDEKGFFFKKTAPR